MNNFTKLNPKISETTIMALNMSTRTSNALIRGGVKTIAQLIDTSIHNLLLIRHIGPNAMQEIETVRQFLRQPANQTAILASWDAKKLQQYHSFFCVPESLQDLPIGHLHLPKYINDALGQINIHMIPELAPLYQGKKLRISDIYAEVIRGRLDILLQSVNMAGQVDWIGYWQRMNIPIIPIDYTFTAHSEDIIWHFPDMVKEILLLNGNNRAWEIIEIRFGLNTHKRQTLEEIGTSIGITRERVRQIQAKALKELRAVLLDNQYDGYSYHVHPEYLVSIQQIFKILIAHSQSNTLETNLFEDLQLTFLVDTIKIRPILRFLLAIAEIKSIEFVDQNIYYLWYQQNIYEDETFQMVMPLLNQVITGEISIPMSEFDILQYINQHLPRTKQLKEYQLSQHLEIYNTIKRRKLS